MTQGGLKKRQAKDKGATVAVVVVTRPPNSTKECARALPGETTAGGLLPITRRTTGDGWQPLPVGVQSLVPPLGPVPAPCSSADLLFR
jgi:hypothetical protein